MLRPAGCSPDGAARARVGVPTRSGEEDLVSTGQVRRLIPSWRWRWRAGHSIDVGILERPVGPGTCQQAFRPRYEAHPVMGPRLSVWMPLSPISALISARPNSSAAMIL